MPASDVEAILSALHTAISDGLTPAVLRNEVIPQTVPVAGLVILRDGEPGEPEITLSPLTYHYEHLVEAEIYVSGTAGRDAAFDAIKQELGVVLAGDRTLGGLCDWIEGQAPRSDDLPVQGGATIKASVVPILLAYAVTDTLG